MSSSSRRIKRICFVERHARSLFVETRATDQIGGAETQQYMLAKEFRDRGIRPSFILDDDPRIVEGVVDGIELLKSYNADTGVRFLRFFYPRLPLLWRALARADADLYYLRGAQDISGIVANFCRMRRRLMFHAIANDSDCERTLFRSEGLRAVAYLHGLRRATRVLAQTETQRRMLQEHFRIDSAIVRNLMPVLPLRPSDGSRTIRRVLWVGTLRSRKRPHWLLSIAARFPELEFEMIGPRTREELDCYHDTVAQIEKLANVCHVPFVPYTEIGRHFEQSDVLVLTSRQEGFPNVLLQAWSCGKPVISTWDPDGVIARHRLGMAVANDEEASAALAAMCRDPSAAAAMGANGRRYVEAHHSPASIVDQLLALAGA